VSLKNALLRTIPMNSRHDIVPGHHQPKWYAMRVTYSREVAFKEYLDVREIESFIPMRYQECYSGGRKCRKLIPVIHNLVFVYSSKKLLDTIKKEVEDRLPVRYIMDREVHCPIVIPEKQMRDFIAVAGTYDEQLIWLDPSTTTYKKGDKVRITGGLFTGVEGELVRIKGDRRVVVSIQGFMAVATAFIHPSLVEKIDPEQEKAVLNKNSKKINYAKRIF
jgi:transcription antitermination factor NusG